MTISIYLTSSNEAKASATTVIVAGSFAANVATVNTT
jgi:hypothetical protein